MMMEEPYLLDTCVASLVLNGELWEQSPFTMMGCKPDVYAAWRLAGESLESTPNKHEELLKSVKAHAWTQQRLANNSPLLYLSPTVLEELGQSPQVCVVYYVYIRRNMILTLVLSLCSMVFGQIPAN